MGGQCEDGGGWRGSSGSHPSKEVVGREEGGEGGNNKGGDGIIIYSHPHQKKYEAISMNKNDLMIFDTGILKFLGSMLQLRTGYTLLIRLSHHNFGKLLHIECNDTESMICQPINII